MAELLPRRIDMEANKAAKASARELERIKLTAYTTRAQRPGPAAAQAQATLCHHRWGSHGYRTFAGAAVVVG